MRITKITAGILALTVPMGIVGFSEDSTDSTIIKDGIEYTIKEDGSARVARILNTELTEVIIPEEINGYKVTELGDTDGTNVFEGCANVTVVMLPASVVSIGDYCFHGVWSLSDVYFSGTAEQFRAMYIGIENDSLVDAQFHFDSGIPDIDDIPDLGIKGDANEDGVVNVSDATTVLKHIIGIITLSEMAFKNADMNGDNRVNVKDATEILRQILVIK